jgi:hypothetical protein
MNSVAIRETTLSTRPLVNKDGVLVYCARDVPLQEDRPMPKTDLIYLRWLLAEYEAFFGRYSARIEACDISP